MRLEVLPACHTLAAARLLTAAHQVSCCEVPVDCTEAAVWRRVPGLSGVRNPAMPLQLAYRILHQTAGLHMCQTMEDWLDGPGSLSVHCMEVAAVPVVLAGVAVVACML